MKRIFLSLCLLTTAMQGMAGSSAMTKANLVLVKDTKHNIVGAMFSGTCPALDAKHVKDQLERVKLDVEHTTLKQYMGSLAKTTMPELRELDIESRKKDKSSSCQLLQYVVLGTFAGDKTMAEDISSITYTSKAGPVTIVAYKKANYWNPEISTMSLTGYNDTPTIWRGEVNSPTYLNIFTPKLFGRDRGLKLEVVSKEKADEIANAKITVGELKTLPDRLKKHGLTVGDYAAGIATKTVAISGLTVLAVLAIPNPGTFDAVTKSIGSVAKGPNKLTDMFKITECDKGKEETATCTVSTVTA